MLKCLLFLCLPTLLFASEKNTKKAFRFLTENKNLTQEISSFKNQIEDDKEKLKYLFSRSMKIFLERKSDHKKHYINHLFKSKYQKFQFNNEQLAELIRIKEDNINRVRDNIGASSEVLDEMRIQPIEYLKAVEASIYFEKKLRKKYDLEKVKCDLKNRDFVFCYNTLNDEILSNLPSNDENELSPKFLKVEPGLFASLVIELPKSGSVSNKGSEVSVELSFFLNGVILSTGDFK